MLQAPAISQLDLLVTATSSESLDSTTIRFWTQNGLKALEKSDRTQTKHIIHFVPITDLQAVEKILGSRWDSELDALLASEKGARNQASPRDASLTQEQTPAQELITLLLPPRPGDICPATWVPPDPDQEGSINVAENINTTVVDTLCKIGSEDWARHVFGIVVPAVKRFLQWVSNISETLRTRYTQQSRELYKQVEKELLARHRIAHWILASSLDLTSDGIEHVLQPLILAFRNFYAQRKFQLDRLATFHAQLSFLRSDFSLLELSTQGEMMSEKVAENMAERAYNIYAQFKPTDFDSKESINRSNRIVAESWSLLCSMIQAFVTVGPDLYDLLLDTARYSLRIRNFFSTTAILVGLKAVDWREPQSEIWQLIDPGDHYRALMAEWNKPLPGIPFLAPLLWKDEDPDNITGEVFRFTGYKIWRKGSMTSSIQEPDRDTLSMLTYKICQNALKGPPRWVITQLRSLLSPFGLCGPSTSESFSDVERCLSNPTNTEQAYYKPREEAIGPRRGTDISSTTESNLVISSQRANQTSSPSRRVSMFKEDLLSPNDHSCLAPVPDDLPPKISPSIVECRSVTSEDSSPATLDSANNSSKRSITSIVKGFSPSYVSTSFRSIPPQNRINRASNSLSRPLASRKQASSEEECTVDHDSDGENVVGDDSNPGIDEKTFFQPVDLKSNRTARCSLITAQLQQCCGTQSYEGDIGCDQG